MRNMYFIGCKLYMKKIEMFIYYLLDGVELQHPDNIN